MINDELFNANVKAMTDNFDCSKVSDGYYTFEELYYHRLILAASLVNANPEICWKSKNHDNDSMRDGYFIVGIETNLGVASYYYELKYWDLFKCKEIEFAPKWDNTPKETIDRIKRQFVDGVN